RHLLDHDTRARRFGTSGKGPSPQPARHPRRLLRLDRLPHERERAEPRHVARCRGASREVSVIDDPRIGIRGQLRPADEGTTDGRNQSHVPRGLTAMSTETTPPPDSLEAKSPFELRVNQSSGAKESFVKRSIETGDVGFLHSFTTGSAVDGPGIRVVAW